MRSRGRMRAEISARYWHIAVWALVGSGLFWLVDFIYLTYFGELPSLKEIWWCAALVPLFFGGMVTLGAGGAALSRRIIGAAVGGALMAVLYSAVSGWLGYGGPPVWADIVAGGVWRVFIFSIFSVLGAILTELKLPDPGLTEPDRT